MSKVEEIIKDVFDKPNLVVSVTVITKDIITELEKLIAAGDTQGSLNFLVDVKDALSLLVGATFASTPEAELITPEVAITVAGINAAPLTEEVVVEPEATIVSAKVKK